jgi:hypothetical protein
MLVGALTVSCRDIDTQIGRREARSMDYRWRTVYVFKCGSRRSARSDNKLYPILGNEEQRSSSSTVGDYGSTADRHAPGGYV